jgi:hypothetical protein
MKQDSIRKHVSELFEEGTADVMVKNARLSSAEQQIVTQDVQKCLDMDCALVQTSMQDANIESFTTAVSGSNNLC